MASIAKKAVAMAVMLGLFLVALISCAGKPSLSLERSLFPVKTGGHPLKNVSHGPACSNDYSNAECSLVITMVGYSLLPTAGGLGPTAGGLIFIDFDLSLT